MGERKVKYDDQTGADDSADDPVDTRTFVWDGQGYEVDLADSTWQEHSDRMQKLIAVSRPTRRIGQTRPVRPPNDPEEVAKARRWADAHGIHVSAAGRFPREVIRAWRANDPSLVRHRHVGDDDEGPPAPSPSSAAGGDLPPAAPGQGRGAEAGG
jgi:hypothetical protein